MTITIKVEVPGLTERSTAREHRFHCGRAANVVKLIADRLANCAGSVTIDYDGIAAEMTVEASPAGRHAA